MERMRVVFVTRRFWPQFGRSENTVANLAVGFRQKGAEAAVVAARWDPDWPRQLSYSGVPVTRLARPRGHAWGTFRYLTALGRWLKSHRDRIDIVCVSQLRLDAYAAQFALRHTSVPVVLRAERPGDDGDCRWQQRSRLGRRLQRRFRTADAVIAPDRTTAAELVECGYDRAQIELIPNGVANHLMCHRRDRAAARPGLAEANGDLELADQAKLVLAVGRLRPNSGLLELVDMWPAVLRRWPQGRLWVIGDGPLRDDLKRRVADLGLRDSVVLPGSFDDLADLLSAADLFVRPSGQAGLPLSLLEAVAVGIPIVAADTPDTRQCPAVCGANALLVPPDDNEALGRALIRMLEQPPQFHALSAARRRVQRDYTCRRMVDEHWRLFERLLHQRRSGATGT